MTSGGPASFIMPLQIGKTPIVVPKFHEQSTLLMISSARILLTLIGMEWFYQAIEQYQYITVRNLLFKFISLLLLFALVKKPEDYLLYCGINIFGVYGSYIVNLIYSQKFISKDKIERLNLRQHMKPIFTFFALSLAISIYTNMDTVMLGFIKGDVEVGYYNLATKIKDVLVAALTALGTVLLPRLSFYYSTGESHKLKKLLGKSMHFTALTTIPAVLFFNIISREAVLFLGGEQYLGIRVLLYWMSPNGKQALLQYRFRNVKDLKIYLCQIYRDSLKTYNNRAMRLLREECRHEFWASYEPASDNSGGKPENECWERCYPYSWKSGLYLRFAEERSEVYCNHVVCCGASHVL